MKRQPIRRRIAFLAALAALCSSAWPAAAQTEKIDDLVTNLQIDYTVADDGKSRTVGIDLYLDDIFLTAVDLMTEVEDRCAIDNIKNSLELAKRSIAFSKADWRALQGSFESIEVFAGGSHFGTMDLTAASRNLVIDGVFPKDKEDPPGVDDCCDRHEDVQENCDGPNPATTTTQITLPCVYSDGCRLITGTKTCNLVRQWQITTCVEITTVWYTPILPPPDCCEGFTCPTDIETHTGDPVVTQTLVSQYIDSASCSECA